MEHVEGGTLREWLAARTRPWREIVAMFVQIGKGLAGAHAAGVVHRAFKPDNILVCENGVPKIADLGLVSLSAALHASATGSDDALERVCSATAISAGASVGVVALTRKGALAGTPAYMAPEQFLGKAIDARTDQFAFCVALYEALYGARPFPGETVVTLADAVTSGKIEDTLPKGAVPGWIRTCLLRGLRVEAGLRYQSIDDVLAALTSDPWIRRRRLILTAVCGLAVVAGAIATQHFVSLR
jgi:serine/threonine protein kinase